MSWPPLPVTQIFYSRDQAEVQQVLADLAAAEADLEALEERWLELEEMSS